MSEWFYVRLALGLTWLALGGYIFLLNRRRVAAEAALRDLPDGGVE